MLASVRLPPEKPKSLSRGFLERGDGTTTAQPQGGAELGAPPVPGAQCRGKVSCVEMTPDEPLESVVEALLVQN